LPDPIDTGPPEMFRGDPSHTGRQGDAGPDGDPVLLWRFPLGNRPSSSPAVAAGVIYVGGEDGLYAVDALTGAERWHVATEFPTTASPAVVGGVVYVGGVDHVFYAIDAGTGIERWRFETGGKIRSSAVVADGAVYFSSYDGNLYALDAGTGEERWRSDRAGDDLFSSPAVADGVVYVGGGDMDGGTLLALNAEDGSPVWRYRVAANIATSPTLLGGIVYAGSDDGYLYAIDVASGKRQCRHYMEKIIRSSPAALDGVIVVANRLHRLVALNAGTCEPLWQFEAGDWIDSSPAVSGNTLYLGSKDDSLYAVNAGTGEERWSFPTGGSITTSPAVAGGVVYFASQDGFLYAVTGSQNEGASAPPKEDAARPVSAPAELTVAGERYRFDRIVPVDHDELVGIPDTGSIDLLEREGREATDPVYLSVPLTDGTDVIARYLPERVGAAQLACPAEGAPISATLATGDATYAFAAIETDFTTDDLTPIRDNSDIGAIYAEAKEGPFRELFAESSDGLQRFVLLDADGVPEALSGRFPFAGQTFVITGTDTGGVDANDLQRVGCAGPFAIEVPPDASSPPFSRIYARVANKLLAFDPVNTATDESASSGGSSSLLAALLPIGIIAAVRGRTSPRGTRSVPTDRVIGRGGPPSPPCSKTSTSNRADNAT
ncbi:MAG TPA: PQQ-binding-like beta-propeller repeat protein, partial [Thermomicrobiales bacterium]|nr:PQQ-binding-like beta-propeller repeat protein [Thermomicrobiales bacterium]